MSGRLSEKSASTHLCTVESDILVQARLVQYALNDLADHL